MPGTKKKLFFMLFLLKKPREIIVWRSCPPSQSIERGRISREGALDHRESRERRDKIFAEKTENAKNFKKNGSGTADLSGELLFFGRGKRKLIFWGGVYNFKTG